MEESRGVVASPRGRQQGHCGRGWRHRAATAQPASWNGALSNRVITRAGIDSRGRQSPDRLAGPASAFPTNPPLLLLPPDRTLNHIHPALHVPTPRHTPPPPLPDDPPPLTSP